MDTRRARPEQAYLIRVDGDHDPNQVADRLTSIGFSLDRVLLRQHLLSGRADPMIEGRMREVPGVKMVRHEGAVSLPPFDDKVPQ